MGQTLLHIHGVSKEYYGNKVLRNIDITVAKGEIHAIIGENGAGKSTLMNILFGMPVIFSTGGYTGDIQIDGQKASINSPFEAMKAGIGMVHQEFMLIPGFTITENIKINRETLEDNIFSRLISKQLMSLNKESMAADTRKALEQLDMNIDEYAKVEGLPVGHMQFIEIAREIDKTGLKILVFDEPTAVLTESEAANLLAAIRRLAQKGIGIIFISHRLNEIISVADRVTILRDGEQVATKDVLDTNAHEIAELMVGRNVSIERSASSADRKIGAPILSLQDFHVNMPGEAVKGVDLEICQGEIVGIGGLAGQGKLGIANGIMGIYPSSGQIIFDGKQITRHRPKDVINSGIAFVSEDRKGVGLLLDESIEMNIVFTALQMQNRFLYKAGFIKLKNKTKIKQYAEKMVEELDIRCSSTIQPTGRLSGGNQQKVCLARALTQEPRLLLVSEPTRGIDIGAKKLILDLLLKLNRESNMTIVMTSSELAEMRSICDRIVIVCEGRVAGVLAPDAPYASFGLMMSGGRPAPANGGMKIEEQR